MVYHNETIRNDKNIFLSFAQFITHIIPLRSFDIISNVKITFEHPELRCACVVKRAL